MDPDIANLVGALSLAVMDRIEQAARHVTSHGGETPAALVVIGYGPGISNDRLRRILNRSHSGTVRLVDRLVADGLVERRPGYDGREVALHLTTKGAATRREVLASRISTVASLLEVLSKSEKTAVRAYNPSGALAAGDLRVGPLHHLPDVRQRTLHELPVAHKKSKRDT